jgi:RNA polymerase sigma-54 factor
MSLKLTQELKLSQQLIMTPQLQMAIKLLQLSRLELMDAIHQELVENPALEEIQETAPDATVAEKTESQSEESQSTKEITIEERIPDEMDWSNYIDEFNTPGRFRMETERKERINFESFTAKKESLKDHLLWQLLMTFPTENEEKIGSLIVGNLNRDGYLDITVEDLVKTSACTPEKVQQVLTRLQTFDPIGVCARNLKECLLIQVSHLGLENSLVTDIVQNHINHLENKNYKVISKALKTSLESVISAVNIIKGLEPKPGREFSDEVHRYITPDIYVHKLDNEFVITLNDDGLPRLRINSYYQNAVNRGGTITGTEKEYLQDKLRSAAWLIRSIHQRQKTIYKVMKSILHFQQDFFEKGVAHLRPMVLRDVAMDISMHESTISRVTTNKYAYTPQGIFELKYFFNSSINRVHGGSIASASVQEKIRQVIESEFPAHPYSDKKIVGILKKSNINIARRTVAKYREIMKILPSSKRKQL